MWDERYEADDYLFGKAPNAFLVRCVGHIPTNGKVLALADGEGRNGVWLAEQGFEVVSVDSAPNALAKARSLADERGVNLTIEHVDLLNWDWPVDEFDAVVAIFIQFVGPMERQRIFQNMVQAIKRGSVVLLEGYRPEQLDYGTGGPPLIENLYTEKQLRAELSDLTIEHLESYDADIQEGTGHAGISALIDLIGRKP